MAAATLVCVPTRPEFPEGFPLTLTEALTAHTPILASDHPVFTRVLRDGEGLRYFAAGNAAALAQLMATVADDAAGYEAALPPDVGRVREAPVPREFSRDRRAVAAAQSRRRRRLNSSDLDLRAVPESDELSGGPRSSLCR